MTFVVIGVLRVKTTKDMLALLINYIISIFLKLVDYDNRNECFN